MSRRTLFAGGGGATIPGPLDPDPPATMHVFALNGQSNMWGQYGYDAQLDTSDPRILVWPGSGDDIGAIIEAVEPLPGLVTPGYGPPTGIGPGMAFARALLPTLPADDTILLVPNAVGSTLLVTDWSPDVSNNRYTQAITRTNAALAAGEGAVLSGFLWLQGESDALNNIPGTAYEPLLDDLIAGMRTAITDADDAPFLVLGMVPEFTSGTAAEIRAVHADTPNRVTGTAYVPGPADHHMGDSLHYDGPGQRTLGAATYDAWSEL